MRRGVCVKIPSIGPILRALIADSKKGSPGGLLIIAPSDVALPLNL